MEGWKDGGMESWRWSDGEVETWISTHKWNDTVYDRELECC